MATEAHLGGDGIVYHHGEGEQTAEVAAANIAAMKGAMPESQLHLMAVDLNDAGDVTREARALYRDFVIEITGPNADPRWTICFIGGSPFLRTVVKFIVIAAGRSGRIGFQSTREAARVWLMAHREGADLDGAASDADPDGAPK